MATRARLQLSIQSEVLQQLRQIADTQHRSLSNMVEHLVRQAFSERNHV
jgi:hypothetical protein